MVRRISLMLLILLLFCSFIGFDARADDFYAVGYEYQSPYHELRVEGSISTARVIADNCGRAGIEQDITIVTDTGRLMVEILNWYKQGKVVVGITVYKDGEDYFTEKVVASEGVIYDYEVYLCRGSIYVSIYDGNELVYHKILKDMGARYIPLTASYVEYYRDCDCSFYYYGWVSISNTKYIDCNVSDFYHKSKGLPFGIYFVHHTWERGDGSIFYLDKGEIDDRL